MKKKSVSITAQSVFIICVLLLLANILLGVLLFSRSNTQMKTLINLRMLDIANTSADMLDGDKFEAFTKESEGTPDYQECFNTLKKFQDNIDLEYIYAVRDMKDGSFVFVCDPAEEDAGEYGAPIKVTDALIKASQGTAAVDEVPYTDEWGKFYSAYSPFFDSKGDVAGIVCVDFRADWYDDQLSSNVIVVVLFSFLSLMVGGLVVVVVTSRLRSRMRSLNTELGELTKDVDELIREINAGKDSQNITVDEKTDDTDQPANEMTELGSMVTTIRQMLRKHTDNLKTRENGMITAMSSDYRSVYYIDLDKDEGICYRAHGEIESELHEGEKFCFSEVFRRYAEKYIVEKNREDYLKVIDPDNIKKELEKESIVAHRYMVNRNGRESYEMFRMAGVRRPEDRDDKTIHAIGAGFTDVDKETRENLLQQQALSDSLVIAEEASKAKTAFLNSMSHEIRTPMNAIIGFDRLALSEDDIPDKIKDYLEKIGESAQHLLGLINDILDMSRIESGRATLKHEAFSMKKLIEQINVMVDSQCREKKLSYECTVKNDLGNSYIGDDMKLRQVIINILGNAVKFTPEGGRVSFLIERTVHFEDNSTFCFTIKDTGVGIDEEFLPKIFDAFSQEDSTVTNKYGSTGLGMAITKNIVDMMNGKIEVESTKGQGTTFTVTVTLEDSDISETDDVSEDVLGAQIDKTAEQGDKENTQDVLNGTRVLLAEDMAINAEIMINLLGMRGVTAEHAENGKIAVDMFSSHDKGWYDAVLMDLRMPEMGGLEAASAIRALDREDAKDIPIIALTANAFDEDVQHSLQAGMNAHLSKPVEPEVLYETLEKFLR